VALPKVNTKSLIKSKLPASTTNTLSVPKPTAELSNVETLNSKNLVGEGNTPLPETIKDQKIAEGVEKNTPGMAACIKEKIKDLAGVFTVPLGIPSFDQFKVPDINDAPNLSVKDAFKATFDDIKNTVKGTVNGIKEAFTFKKQQGLDQIETGGLSLKKFLGCEEMDVDFTPRERKEAAEKPEIITKKEEEGVKKSQVALAAQADKNVKQRTEPPAEKSKQEDVKAITPAKVVEEQGRLPFQGYYIIFADSEILQDENYSTIFEVLYSELITSFPELEFKSFNDQRNLLKTVQEAADEGENASVEQSNEDLNELTKDRSGILLVFEFSSDGIGTDEATALPSINNFKRVIRIFNVYKIQDEVGEKQKLLYKSEFSIDRFLRGTINELVPGVLQKALDNYLEKALISEGNELDNR
jgi:hypothetical protein